MKLSSIPVGILGLVAGGLGYSCATDAAGASSAWAGTADTMPNGRVVVHNPDAEVWTDASRWTVREELRIGALDGTGPDVFGNITTFEVAADGRFYIYERQAMQLRVFDAGGLHVRTIGRQGGGPGEFSQVIGMAWAPDGTLWVIDPGNNRVSVFDTAGTYVTNHRMQGGYIMMPWPGGFDSEGRFYNLGVDANAEPDERLALTRFGTDMLPLDTLRIPRDRVVREAFELRSERGFMTAGVPHQATMQWRFTRDGFVTVRTGEYRIDRLSWTQDTLLTVTKAFTRLPVTDEDIEGAVEELEWFTGQGGQIDYDKFPDEKPGVAAFLVDDQGYFWSAPVMADGSERRVFEIFDPAGRYLGRVHLPFEMQTFPRPIIRGDNIYSVVEDELEVPYVVRARIERP